MFENDRKGGRPSKRPTRDELLHLSEILTIEQIAQLYSVNRSTVCNWKKFYRLPPKVGRPTQRPSARKLNNLCKKYSYAEIAKQFNVPVGTVASWVHYYKHKNDKKGAR